MDIVLATDNRHKVQELSQILAGHRVVRPQDLDVVFDHAETGDTFLENAVAKAQALRRELLRGRASPGTRDAMATTAVLADDSGLCVDALDGRPGIFSARYGSPDGGESELAADQRNALLLQELKGVEARQAHFVCCMVVLLEGERLIVVQEQWDGEIATFPSVATGGFGYDPVFYLPELGCTAADLPAEEKNRLSHRGKAAARLAQLLGEGRS